MICPTCKNDMIVVEYQQVQLDYCLNCHGAWFDSGELEILLESLGVSGMKSFLDSILSSSDARTAEKQRKCPICSRKMKKVNTCAGGKVLIDTCVQGDGIWFDSGEVDKLVKELCDILPEKAGNKEVFNFVKEVLKAR